MKFLLALSLGLSFYLLMSNQFDDKYKAGYAAGKREALKTSPPSEDLEMACAGLWVGEQNRKYFQAQK